MENEIVTYQQIVDACKQIAETIKINPLTFDVKNIYGVPRGGLILAIHLSHLLDLPLSLFPTKDSLIVDDISDTGNTLSIFSGRNPIVTMYYHRQALVIPDIWVYEKKDKWIQFPWESK